MSTFDFKGSVCVRTLSLLRLMPIPALATASSRVDASTDVTYRHHQHKRVSDVQHVDGRQRVEAR